MGSDCVDLSGPHVARVIVLLLKTLLTTITLSGGRGRCVQRCLLCAHSKPARGTKGCVGDDAAADNFPLSVYMQPSTTGSANDFGCQHSGAGNHRDKAVSEKGFLGRRE